MKLVPDTARLKHGDQEITVHAHELEPEDVIIIKPGDKIALDGTVIARASFVNQAPITGESVPVTKTLGDEVFAGTLNEDGYLEVKVTKKYDETTLAKIVKLVDDAQQQKSSTEAFIDRFSCYYTPAVIGLAVLTALIPPLIWGLPFDVWFYRALILLVVSCPCALAISTPVAMVSGITSAARHGVLIKGGHYVEDTGNVKIMVFDKTGTLTEGRLEVTDVVALNEYSAHTVLQIAASLEVQSQHPIARAIMARAAQEHVTTHPVSEFKSIAGKGVQGTIDAEVFYLGNADLINTRSSESLHTTVEDLEQGGKTTVLLGTRDLPVGIIALTDKLRVTSQTTIQELKKTGDKNYNVDRRQRASC